MRNIHASAILLVVIVLLGCKANLSLTHQTISKSTVFPQKIVKINMDDYADSIYLRVQGDDIILDFSGTVIDARVHRDQPNTFSGIGIYIADSRNVTIKNLSVHGFKIAILAERVERLKIENCNLSYNYRPKLYSKWDRESLSDWLYYHNNENDEWKRYGAAIYLKDCDHATINEVTCQQGMNGLLMVGCERGDVYNNNFSFNSGLGIGLYRSGRNSIQHNKLDWNARGYSHGKYARGQDSAGILLYEQSSHNSISYNSATHSGDGLFLWAGQSTMDTGMGGCDSNWMYRNDFSHSIANAIEVTFSSNLMYDNKLNDSRYGVWGGYSHHSEIVDNEISGCDIGVAIEHGNNNIIVGNQFDSCRIGIQLWERETQPDDWPYAKVLDVTSRNYTIANNTFNAVTKPFEITNTDSVFLPEGITDFDQFPSWTKNWQLAADEHRTIISSQSPSVADRTYQNAALPPGTLRGREYIIVNEWGPYNFQYPNLVLRNKEIVGEQEVYTFAVFGPTGTWSLKSIEGFESISPDSGMVTDNFFAYLPLLSESAELVLEYKGSEFIDQFGDTTKAGTATDLVYRENAVKTEWFAVFFQYDTKTDPLLNPDAFSELLGGPEKVKEQFNQLAFRWWDKPHEKIARDHFAIRATADITTQEDTYTFQVESDDGIRLWIDGELILDRWNIHTPTIDEISIPLSAGRHHIELEYFEATGLAVLDVLISR